jgi:hypothetical protein
MMDFQGSRKGIWRHSRWYLREEREMEMDGKYGMILKRYCSNIVAKFIKFIKFSYISHILRVHVLHPYQEAKHDETVV